MARTFSVVTPGNDQTPSNQVQPTDQRATLISAVQTVILAQGTKRDARRSETRCWRNPIHRASKLP